MLPSGNFSQVSRPLIIAEIQFLRPNDSKIHEKFLPGNIAFVHKLYFQICIKKLTSNNINWAYKKMKIKPQQLTQTSKTTMWL